MKILHLNLYRKYFDAILKGDKTIEYRDITPYWSKVAPEMVVEYKGMGIDDGRYAIQLGKILETNNVT